MHTKHQKEEFTPWPRGRTRGNLLLVEMPGSLLT